MRNFKYTYNLKHFTNIDDISYYLLGAFITDGCIHQGSGHGQSSITSSYKDWLELIRIFSCPTKPIYKSKVDNCYTLTLSHPTIREFFVKNKCTPKKSLTIEMPDVPDQYLPDFLRGCIDGDGHIHISKNSNSINCELVSASKLFIDELSKKLLKFNPKIYCSYNKYYKLRMHGIHAYKFLKYIYYVDNKISMPRKLLVAQQAILKYEQYGFDLNANNIDIQHQVRSSTQSGSNNGASKLDENQVKLILELASNKSTKELMAQFRVSETTINKIKSGKSWRCITKKNQMDNTLKTVI